jgi:hypothetical protein
MDCIAPPREALSLREKQTHRGGETIALVNGANQIFADTWRGLAGLAPVPVSMVLAQGFKTSEAGRFVELVEFDRHRCAITRTTLSGDMWNAIMRLAALPAYDI